MPYTIVEDGRQRIGVNQPPGSGGNYPFVAPSPDIQDLFGDAQLTYTDEKCQFQRPFSVAFLYGFGGIATSQPAGMPNPTHTYDCVVVDALGRTVFDSTRASVFQQAPDWDGRLRILQWIGEEAVLQLTTYIAWGPEDAPRDYGVFIAPVNGVLDERVPLREPRHLEAIAAAGYSFSGSGLRLQNGYNTTLVVGNAQTADGGVHSTDITIAAAPGSGLGRYPGCLPPSPGIKTINSIAADANGNFKLDALGCYRLERPNYIVSANYPRTALASPPSALQLFNNCTPCCECADFVAVYQAIRRLRARYLTLGNRAERARDTFAANRTRWNEQKACRDANPLRLSMIPLCPNELSVAGAFCNTTGGALRNLQLQFNFQYANHGVFAATTRPGSVVCGLTFRSGNYGNQALGTMLGSIREAVNQEPYSLGGSYPAYTANFDCVQPGALAYVTFRMKFPKATLADNVQLVLTATQNNQLIAGPGLRSSGLLPPDKHGNCPCDQAASGSSL